jgi:hypothetical protein
MAVLRTAFMSDAQAELSRVRPGVPSGLHTDIRLGGRVRNAIAMLVYSAGYPLLAVALWMGARNGEWLRSTLFVALGVFVSFAGWALIKATGSGRATETAIEQERHQTLSVYLALYNRAGAIVVLLGSYAIAATGQGWPTPRTFVGWFVLVWIPLFVSFAIPVDRSSRSIERDE